MSKTLHFAYAADKTLVARTGQVADFVRATEGSFWNSIGVLETAASGAARFGHDPVTLESLGYLDEEPRTNLAWPSEDFADARWNKSNLTLGSTTTAPDATDSFQIMLETTDNAAHSLNLPSVTVALDDEHTWVAYLSKHTRDFVYLQTYISGQGSKYTYFNMTTGAIGSTAAEHTATMEDVGGGIYRCSITHTAPGAGATSFYAGCSIVDGTPSYTGDITEGFKFWGAEIDKAAFPLSYIKTLTTTVTRNIDQNSTPDTVWFNHPEGTFYVAYQPIDTTYDALGYLISVHDDATALNRHQLYAGTTRAMTYQVRLAGSVVAIPKISNALVAGVMSRISASYKVDDVIHFLDGTGSVLDTNCDMPVSIAECIIAGSQGNALSANGYISELAFFDEWSDDETQEDYTTNGLPVERSNYIAITRRTAKQMRPKQRMASPKQNLDEFLK